MGNNKRGENLLEREAEEAEAITHLFERTPIAKEIGLEIFNKTAHPSDYMISEYQYNLFRALWEKEYEQENGKLPDYS
jgi:hypothetical protein